MDELLDAAEKYRTEHRHLTETVERTQRFAEALANDTDPSRREVAAELIEIVGDLP